MKINQYNFIVISIIVVSLALIFTVITYFIDFSSSVLWFSGLFLLLLTIGIVIYDRINTNRLRTSFGRFIYQIKKGNFESKQSDIIQKYDFVNITDIQVELSEIVGQIQADYKEQNRYIENVSHELMTPIAIIRGKLELLIQSPNIKKNDFSLINDILLKLERLAKVNQSLVLLSKIDHNQYTSVEEVNFNEIIDETLNLFEDQIRIDEISIRKNIQSPVFFKMNETLAYLLVKNIIKNAVIHNVYKGFITVLFEEKKIMIKNSGININVSTDKLFERFEVINENQDSIGLGLSIIKRICEVSDIELNYKHQEGVHQIILSF